MDTLVNSVTAQLKSIKKNFEQSRDLKALKENLEEFSEKYKNHLGIGDVLINCGVDFCPSKVI